MCTVGALMRVLVALDDSEQATTVARMLAPWLREARATIDLVSVVDMTEVRATMRSGQRGIEPVGAIGATRSSVQPPPPHAAESHGQALVRARSEREDFLRQIVGECLPDLDVVVRVVSDDDTAGAIATLALELDADLVAVGTHGRSGLTRAVMGSVAEQVVRRCERPVMVARAGMRARADRAGSR